MHGLPSGFSGALRLVPLSRLNGVQCWTPVLRRNKLVGEWRSTRGPSFCSMHHKPEQSRDVTTADNVDNSPLVPWKLHTLSRDKLSTEDYVDLSDARALAVDPDRTASSHAQPEARPAIITYGSRKGAFYTPFPVNTRGFFYYLSHPRSPLGGSIRFRVVQAADPRQFHAGRNLLNEHGTAWEFPLLSVLHLARYELLQKALFNDAFVTPELLAKHAGQIKTSRHWFMDAQVQAVNQAFQPFYVDLTDMKQKVFVPGDFGVFPLWTDTLFVAPRTEVDERKHYDARWPFTEGRLLCQLEVHRRPQAPKGKQLVVVVRVLRIVEPVRVKDKPPRGTAFVDLPLAPGKLLTISGEVVQLHLLGKQQAHLADTLIRRNGMRYAAQRKREQDGPPTRSPKLKQKNK